MEREERRRRELTVWVWALGLVASAGEIVVRPRLWGDGEIRWVDDGVDVLLERFPSPERVRATAVSADGRYAFAWHRPDGQALRVSTYDLERGALIASFSPGFGGSLSFGPRGRLVHRWGCGTNCAMLQVYGVRGEQVLSRETSGLDVSPDSAWALTYPTLHHADEPIALFDLQSGREVATWAKTPTACAAEVTWGAEGVSLVVLDARPDPEAPSRHRLTIGLDGTLTWRDPPPPP